ncbi:MAG TPA: methionyl-tRNA formyltransferase [Patescibacteria group bacterium]|nr:methionyl-tRNA formyltransferase [Patescibacteria group bacterium]
MEKVIFFGSGPYVKTIIEKLKENYDLALVVTTETSRNEPVIAFAKRNNIDVLSVEKITDEVIVEIEKIGAKVAVLAYFGIIVPQKLLDIFPLGIINIHPSLLPKYRGPTPGQAAILAGETTTGVSIIKLDSEVDHGPILCMIDHTISPDDNSDTLYKKLFEASADLLMDVLPKYIDGKLELTEQDHSKATFTERFDSKTGEMNINNVPENLDLMIRAYYPWSTVRFHAALNGKEKLIKLFPGNPAERDGSSPKIQVEGKNIVPLKDFANGYPEGHDILKKLNLHE